MHGRCEWESNPGPNLHMREESKYRQCISRSQTEIHKINNLLNSAYHLLSFFLSFNLTSIPGPERSIWRQLQSWLDQNTPRYSRHTGTGGISHQYFTFTSVHMLIHVVMRISPNVCCWAEFSATNRQTAMTFSLIPIAHHNQFQPLINSLNSRASWWAAHLELIPPYWAFHLATCKPINPNTHIYSTKSSGQRC